MYVREKQIRIKVEGTLQHLRDIVLHLADQRENFLLLDTASSTLQKSIPRLFVRVVFRL